QLIVAEADARFLEQVRVQASQRPNAEAISQLLWRRVDGSSQGGPILWCRPRRPPWRLARNQTVQTVLTVAFANDVDRPDAAAKIVSNRSLRSSHGTHQDDRCVAEYSSVGRTETQMVQRIPALIG